MIVPLPTNWLTRFFLRFSAPYRKGHIYGVDGSLYMARYSLFETRWLSARLHGINRPDLDRHAHDHPWNFVSVVLAGGYLEFRPATLEPCFDGESEKGGLQSRGRWTVALRRATDRHLIAAVLPGTWSLFVYGPERQWWGFYTPAGKIHWRDYLAARGQRVNET